MVSTNRPLVVLERLIANEVRPGVILTNQRRALTRLSHGRRLHQQVDSYSRVWRGHDLTCRRSLGLSSPHLYQAKLTPAEVTNILRANEYTNNDLPPGPVKSFDTNTLQSNNPIEDSHAEAMLTTDNNGLLFGIFDGHGGAACGQVVAKRLFHYIAAGLLPPQELTNHIKAIESGDASHEDYKLVRNFNDNFELVRDLKDLYHNSYIQHLQRLLAKRVEIGDNDQINDVGEILTSSFLSLDDDMSSEATTKTGGHVNMKTVTVAMSGCVAAAAYIEVRHLYFKK